MMDLSFLANSGFSKANKEGIFEIPFLDRMGFVFLFSMAGMYIISVIDNRKGIKPNGLEVDSSMFKMKTSFMVGSLIVCAILVALFSLFW